MSNERGRKLEGVGVGVNAGVIVGENMVMFQNFQTR